MATDTGLSAAYASQRAERVNFYRRIYVNGIGRSPSRIRKQDLQRACELDALADEIRATSSDPIEVVRVQRCADRQRQKPVWLKPDVSPDADADEISQEYFKHIAEAGP